MHGWGLKMFRIYISSLFVVLLGMCALSGAQTAQVVQTKGDSIRAERADLPPQTNSTEVQFSERDPRYRVRKSDVIEVKFKFSPEFDQTVTVQPDGFITLDGAGDLKVEDKTLPRVDREHPARVQGILHEPAITVSLKDFDKPFFLAAGQVGTSWQV